MRRLFQLKVILVIILAAAVAAVISAAMNQKQRLQVMDAEERRRYLGSKLEGRISEDQIDQLAAKISERLDAGGSGTETEVEGGSESEGEGAETPATDS